MFRTCMLLLCALPLISAAAPKVAFVYSSWSNATFKNEFDTHFKKLGWECDKYENSKLPELSDKLDGYDYVVAAAVANYEHVVDMKPLPDQRRRIDRHRRQLRLRPRQMGRHVRRKFRLPRTELHSPQQQRSKEQGKDLQGSSAHADAATARRPPQDALRPLGAYQRSCAAMECAFNMR